MEDIPPRSDHVGSRRYHFLSSCSVRPSLALVLSTPCSRNQVRCPIRRSAPTYRKFHFLRSPESFITHSAIPQEGTLGFSFDQVLGYPKHHDERPLFSVKTRNNRTIAHDSLLSNKSRGHYAANCSVVLCLFHQWVYKIGCKS